MGKKNLEQLFKETFEGFQEIPDEKVWNSIEASLDKKKQKKRAVPLWWQLGGVAALLAVLFYVFNPFENTQDQNEIIITDTETKIDPTLDDEPSGSSKEQIDPATINNGDEGLVESSSKTGVDKNQAKAENNNSNPSLTSKQQQVVENHGLEKNSGNTQNAVAISQSTRESNALAMSDKKEEGREATSNQKRNTIDNAISESNKAIAQDNTVDKKLQNIREAKNDEAIAENKEEIVEDGKKSIFDAIREQEEETIIADNTAAGKWSVGPSVAPVYFSAAGKGSPIHSDFASNSKSGNLNLSYGLSVAYEVGKKLKIKSGVHRVNYGYDTNDVLFSSSARSAASDKLANINYSQKSETLVVQSKNSLPNSIPTDAFLELASNEIPVLDGKMVQQLGYIEVPVELNYAVIDRKFGVDLIGGVSSLFLVENSVLVESEGLVTEVGEATNANDVNFSANFGMGLNYDFSPKVELSVEPVFKYQMNTFSKTAGEFQPFSIGIYSGISFKF